MKLRRILLFSLSLAPAWASSRLAIATPLLVDQPAAVAYTLAHNPDVLAAESQLAAARSHVVQAEALPNPQLGLAVAGFNPQNQAGESIALQLTQTLQLTDQRGVKRDMARADVEMAEDDLSLARRQATVASEKAYNQVLAMRFALQQARDDEDWSDRLAEAAAAKLALGEIPAAESYRAKVAAAQARQVALSAQNDLYQALEALKLAMGTVQPIDVPATPYAVPLWRLPDTAQLVQLGLQHRPELFRSAASLRHEALNAQLIRATVLPGVDLTTGAGPVSGIPGALGSVSLPLPLWYRQEGELAESAATQQELQQQQTATRNAVVVQIEQACHTLALNEAQIRLYQATLLPNARTLLEQTRQRYLYGDASGYELQDARRSYRQAMTAYGQAYLDYRNALADLETAIGTELPQPKE